MCLLAAHGGGRYGTGEESGCTSPAEASLPWGRRIAAQSPLPIPEASQEYRQWGFLFSPGETRLTGNVGHSMQSSKERKKKSAETHEHLHYQTEH